MTNIAALFREGRSGLVGTGWVCSQGYALTAAHCVGNRKERAVFAESYSLHFGRTRSQVSVISVDFDRDLALLRIDEGSDQWQPLNLASWMHTVFDSRSGYGWHSFAFADAHSEGLHLTGTVTSVNGSVDGIPALQLQCDQGGLGHLTGASGAPVLRNDGSAVGIIRYGVLHQSIMFATAMKEVVASFDDVIDWDFSVGASIAHPLHAFPRGPMVPLHLVTGELTDAFADLHGDIHDARELIHKAVRLRLDAEPGADPNDRSKILKLGSLPNLGAGIPARSWWQSTLHEACKKGPPMLAALLLVETGERFNIQAQKDRETLLSYLHQMAFDDSHL